MAFPDYTSTFSNPSFGIDTAGAFSGTVGNLSGAGGLASKTGGFSMDPFSIGLGVAGIGASIFGGINQSQAQADAIKAQVAGANFAAQQQANAKALQMAQGLLGMQFGEFIAAPRELERQKEAKMFEAGPLAGLQRAGREEDFRRALSQQERSKDIKRFESVLNAKAQSFANRAQARGMFGPTLEDQMFGA